MINIAKEKVVVGQNIYRLIKKDGSIIENPNIDGLTVEFSGRMGGCVEIEEGSIFRNTTIKAGGFGYIHIKKTHEKGIKNTTIRTACPCQYKYLFIDEQCSIEGATFTLVDDDSLVVTVGKDCMFSSGITVRAADGHTIFDINSGEVINRAKPITIGNHVWIGANSIILKGASIPNNSILGTGSVISKPFKDEFVAIAGIPADIIKRNIGWHRERIFEYMKNRAIQP